jgi:hypothetical protein
LEDALLSGVYSIGEANSVGEARYVDGLRRAVSAALAYGMLAIERNQNRGPLTIPEALLTQARLAARSGVSHDTVLRRLCAGNLLFADALIEEAEQSGLPRGELKRFFRRLGSNFDQLLAAVSEEYVSEELSQVRERLSRHKSGPQRRDGGPLWAEEIEGGG